MTVDEFLTFAGGVAVEAGVARAAVFDVDGTLWRGDLGDEAFAHAHEEGLVNDDTWARIKDFARKYGVELSDYAQLVDLVLSGALSKIAFERGVDEDTFRHDLYSMQAWVYAGHARGAVIDYGKRLLARGFANGIFADMQRVLDGLRRLRFKLGLVSASHGALIEAARSSFDVDFIRGMEPVVDDHDITQPAIAFSTYGLGKVIAARELCRGERPLFAFGDSVLFTDRHLLALAQHPVAVNTRGAHREHAIARGFIMLDPSS